MAEWAAWLQDSSLAQGLRAGSWAYPLVNLAHVIGIALLFGAIATLDLRLLGLWRGVPVAALARPLVPVAATGLGIAPLTGPLLLAVQAVDYAANPILYVKFAAIALGVVNMAVLHRSRVLNSADPSSIARRLGVAGGISLVSWLTAIAAGRMIAYW